MQEQLHAHAGTLSDHAMRLVRVETQMDALQRVIPTLATQDQVDAAERRVTARVDSCTDLLDAKMTHVVDTVAPLRKGIYWVVTLILGAVILGVLALLFRQGG